MKKTVEELILMYENGLGNAPKSFNSNLIGKLHTDMSTQRQFIYNNEYVNDEQDNKLTRSGYLIQSLIEKHIQLPALYFWNVQDDKEDIHYSDNEFNLHDGKQRFLSIYNFIRGSNGDRVVTRIQMNEKDCSEECTFGNLTSEQQEYLLKYEFDIVIRKGTKSEEEESFFLLNTTSVPLTRYEGLRGAYYGTYIYEFEKYIDNLKLDRIKKVGRGEQAEFLLYMALGIIDEDKKFLLRDAQKLLSIKRNFHFNRNENNFSKKIEIYNDFISMSIKSGSDEGNKKQKIAQIATYIVNHKYDTFKIMSYYRQGFKVVNDIDNWKFKHHQKAIDNLMINNIYCDYRRFFNLDEKSQLFKKSNICGKCGKSFGFNELDVDHIKPWSEGGSTDISNAQLLCKSCNCSKGNN